jgi:hypothetical protein
MYTPKEGYTFLIREQVQDEPVWWWKKLWRITCLPKSKLFMWSVLTNKVPTWDILQKRKFYGLGRCSLCKTEGETTQHLFIDCLYIKEVWTKVSRIMKQHFRWIDHSLEQAWRDWWENKELKAYKLLPLLIIWGVWLVRNEVIFKEAFLAPEKTTLKSLAILSSYLPTEGRVKTRSIREVTIDKTKSWVFFYGASQNYRCGGGGILHFSESHFYTLTSGLGEGKNNNAELMSLKLLMAFAIE